MNIQSVALCDRKIYKMNHRAVKINRWCRMIPNLALPLLKQLIRTGLRSMPIKLMVGTSKRSLAPSSCYIMEYRVTPIWKLLLQLRFKRVHQLLMLYKECHNQKANREIMVSIHLVLCKLMNPGILLSTLLSSHFPIEASTQGELRHRWMQGDQRISIVFYQKRKSWKFFRAP